MRAKLRGRKIGSAKSYLMETRGRVNLTCLFPAVHGRSGISRVFEEQREANTAVCFRPCSCI